MFELIGRNKKKNHILFLIILFSIKFSPINQFPFQTKGTKEQNEAPDTRTIGYKADKASTTYDKKFDYMDQAFNESAQNFFALENLADSKLSFNPLPNYTKTEQLNENLSRVGLRNLQNENYIIAYVNGNQGDQVQVIYRLFSNPDSVTINETNATWNSGKVDLTQTGVNAIKMVWNQNLQDMGMMFYGCSALASLDLSKFDTSQVTDMLQIFSGCSALTSLDLSKFNTSQVKDMYMMFSGCSALTSLDLSKFDTSQVKDMNSMFRGCSALASLDLSKFDTSQVTNMGMMFGGCSALKFINLLYYQGKDIFANLNYNNLSICVGDYMQINNGDNQLKKYNVTISCLQTTIITYPNTITQNDNAKTSEGGKDNAKTSEGGNDNAKTSERGNNIAKTTQGGNNIANNTEVGNNIANNTEVGNNIAKTTAWGPIIDKTAEGGYTVAEIAEGGSIIVKTAETGSKIANTTEEEKNKTCLVIIGFASFIYNKYLKTAFFEIYFYPISGYVYSKVLEFFAYIQYKKQLRKLQEYVKEKVACLQMIRENQNNILYNCSFPTNGEDIDNLEVKTILEEYKFIGQDTEIISASPFAIKFWDNLQNVGAGDLFDKKVYLLDQSIILINNENWAIDIIGEMKDKSFNYSKVDLTIALFSNNSQEKIENISCSTENLYKENDTLNCFAEKKISGELKSAISDLGKDILVVNFLNTSNKIDFASKNVYSFYKKRNKGLSTGGIIAIALVSTFVICSTAILLLLKKKHEKTDNKYDSEFSYIK